MRTDLNANNMKMFGVVLNENMRRRFAEECLQSFLDPVTASPLRDAEEHGERPREVLL